MTGATGFFCTGATSSRRLEVSTRALVVGHPLVGRTCPACGQPFLPGAPVVLVALGPGDDPRDQERWHEGHEVNAPAVPLHAPCAGVSLPANPFEAFAP